MPATRWRSVARTGWPVARAPAWRARWRAERIGTAIPIIAVPVERTIHVVRAPVRGNRESDDGNADACAVVSHVHRLALVGVLHERARHPAAQAHGDDITPAPAFRASLDRYGG